MRKVDNKERNGGRKNIDGNRDRYIVAVTDWPLMQIANHLDSLKIGDNTILIILLKYSVLFLRVLKEYHHATCFCINQNISKGPFFCFIIWKIENIVRLAAQT